MSIGLGLRTNGRHGPVPQTMMHFGRIEHRCSASSGKALATLSTWDAERGVSLRVLRDCGYRVTATDPVEQLISAAERVGSADAYKIAAAADLPFKNCSFDLVVAYNVLMDVEDVPAALKEIGRVLRPLGTLVISIVHPFADRGRFAGPEANAPFVLRESYFGRKRFEGTEIRNGLQMHFAGWSQPLEDYMAALESAAFAITSLREPVPDAGNKGSHMECWNKVPLFLWLKARLLSI